MKVSLGLACFSVSLMRQGVGNWDLQGHWCGLEEVFICPEGAAVKYFGFL